MSVRHRASNLLFVGGLFLAPGIALSQDATMKPHVPLEKTIGQVTPTGRCHRSPCSTRRARNWRAAS